MGQLTSADRGTVIADRYVISEVLRPWLPDHPEAGQVNLGLDAVLDTPVIVYTAREDTAAGLFSTANRAALLADPRIPAITDVGMQDDLVYIVCERTGGTPLSKMLAGGPLTVDQATAVVGEVATALTHADKRGLHHLMLGPESVAVTPEGEVIIRGVGIDAAVADAVEGLELDMLTSSRAARRDALDIINIFYAAITGHWPDDHGRAGLPAAGRKNRRITPVGAFTNDLSDDLEVFLSGVVGGTDPGPRSPSEIVRYLGEWDTGLLTELPQLSRTESELFAESAGPTHPEPDEVAPEASASDAQMANAWARIGLVRPGVSGAAAGVSGSGVTPYDDRMKMAKATRFPLSPDQLSGKPEWTAEDSTPSTVSAHDPNLTAPIMRRDESDPTTQAMPIVHEPEEPAADDGDGSWFLGGMFQTREQEYARQRAEYDHERRLREHARQRAEEAQAAERAQSADNQPAQQPAEARPQAPIVKSAPAATPAPNQTKRTAAGAGAAAAGGTSAAAGAAASSAAVRSTASGSAAGTSAAEKAQNSQTKRSKKGRGPVYTALALITAGIIVLVIAIIWMYQAGGGDTDTATPQPAPETSTPAPAETQEAAEPVKVKITKAKPLDPQGDGTENNAAAKNVLKKKGEWTSDRYNTPEFGGLKDGLGLELTLEGEQKLTKVVLDSKAKGGSYEIRVGDDPEDAKTIGTGEFGKKTEVEFDKPVEADSFYVWITELPTYESNSRAAFSRITAYAEEN